jgi:extracellular factor (EF) 3-hydroxypalmitic acid methyl ester biosynthesis protein
MRLSHSEFFDGWSKMSELTQAELLYYTEIAGALRDSPNRVNELMHDLSQKLLNLRLNISVLDWKKITRLLRSQVLFTVLHEDPFTRRCFQKPRGYQGDAELIDSIYAADSCLVPLTDVSCVGKAIFNFTMHASSPTAVRIRMAEIKERIDEFFSERSSGLVASLGAGHMREFLSTYVYQDSGRDIRAIAFDIDQLSLSQIRQLDFNQKVQTVELDLLALARANPYLSDSDFIFSAGLFDYVGQPTAKRLTRTIVEMLKPGGMALVANFNQLSRDAGYMDVFMDWRLNYRDDGAMLALTDLVPEDLIERISLKRSKSDIVTYLEIVRSL